MVKTFYLSALCTIHFGSFITSKLIPEYAPQCSELVSNNFFESIVEGRPGSCSTLPTDGNAGNVKKDDSQVALDCRIKNQGQKTGPREA